MEQEKTIIREQVDNSLKEWKDQAKMVSELQKIIGDLRFDKGIDLVLFRKDIYEALPSEVLNNHRLALNFASDVLAVNTSLTIVKGIAKMEGLSPSKIDIGKLSLEWQSEKQDFNNVDEFLHYKLRNFVNAEPKNKEEKDVVLYGFGRIGRLAARLLISETGKGEQLRLKAIVIRQKMKDKYEEAKKRAALLIHDSVHGDFNGTVIVSEDGSELIINGNRVKLIFASNPSDIDYTEYGINDAMVIDNTGVWRDEEGLSGHLRPGAKTVLLTAPGKGNIPNVVYGVNQETINVENDNVFSAASCTTNAIVPVLKIILDNYGIEKGHIETIHSYTNDQNLLDNFHKKARRGKGAPINMVLTTTGAASAVTKVFPELTGKLTGNAIRVPTPNVSLAILNLSLKSKTNLNELNAIIKKASLHGGFIEQIYYSDSTEYVSSNAIGMTTTSVVDAPSTIVSEDGLNATIYLWYDNEFGYTCQVIRLAKHIAKVRRHIYY